MKTNRRIFFGEKGPWYIFERRRFVVAMGGHGSREGKRRKWVNVNSCVAAMEFQGRNKVGPFDDFVGATICNNCWIRRSKLVLFHGCGEAVTTREGVTTLAVWRWCRSWSGTCGDGLKGFGEATMAVWSWWRSWSRTGGVV